MTKHQSFCTHLTHAMNWLMNPFHKPSLWDSCYHRTKTIMKAFGIEMGIMMFIFMILALAFLVYYFIIRRYARNFNLSRIPFLKHTRPVYSGSGSGSSAYNNHNNNNNNNNNNNFNDPNLRNRRANKQDEAGDK